MINPAETQPPKEQLVQRINPAETIPPDKAAQSGQSISLVTGESVSDSFVIQSLMETQGKQSTVYLAKKWGKSFVVKVYRNGWRPSEQMQSFLTEVSHPNIAHIVEYGEHAGSYYEIYDFFTEGTLEDVGALTVNHIENVIVPSINEGLHELHRNGIIHCDIKPSNLFYADGGSRVVIGDCGISGYANANGKLIDSVRGTPEYAPPVKSLLWSAAMSPAYDYGSFGLVLCRALLGRSLFSGMSIDEIAGAWDDGLELPAQISGRIGQLIRGLLNENETQRWGYEQVKRWCMGEYLSSNVRNPYAGRKTKRTILPLIFGTFDGQIVTVTTLHQLAKAMSEHWQQATRVIKRQQLVDFVRQFDENLAGLVRELARVQDADAAVYKLLLSIEDDPHQIIFCGRNFGGLADYAAQLATGTDAVAKQFLSSGLLIYYLRHNDYERAAVDKLDALIRRNGCDDMASISTICFTLQGTKTIDLDGTPVTTLDDLIPVLQNRSIQEIDELLADDRFIAWLNRLGYEKDVRKMKEMTE